MSIRRKFASLGRRRKGCNGHDDTGDSTTSKSTTGTGNSNAVSRSPTDNPSSNSSVRTNSVTNAGNDEKNDVSHNHETTSSRHSSDKVNHDSTYYAVTQPSQPSRSDIQHVQHLNGTGSIPTQTTTGENGSAKHDSHSEKTKVIAKPGPESTYTASKTPSANASAGNAGNPKPSMTTETPPRIPSVIETKQNGTEPRLSSQDANDGLRPSQTPTTGQDEIRQENQNRKTDGVTRSSPTSGDLRSSSITSRKDSLRPRETESLPSSQSATTTTAQDPAPRIQDKQEDRKEFGSDKQEEDAQTAPKSRSSEAKQDSRKQETQTNKEETTSKPNPISETTWISVKQEIDQKQASIEERGNSVGKSLAQTKFVNKHHTPYDPTTIVKPAPGHEYGIWATQKYVKAAFEEFAQLIPVSYRPIPSQTGDRSYLAHHGRPTLLSRLTSLVSDIRSLGFKNLKTVRRIMEQKASGAPQNDREYLMEAIIQLASSLPEKSKHRVEVTSRFLDELWVNHQHPPLSYLGDDHRYRSADGSRNSFLNPSLGAANTPYARSVNPVTITPGAPPDPFLIFDSLMARQEFKPNPNKVSSIFFNWASLVIHDLFQTDHHDYSISKTSSYLDLSILYGDTQAEQDKMRTFKDGKIKPDCFSENRLLAFPPTAGVMLIMLNRFHNHVVEQLALINEGGRFKKPPGNLSDEAAKSAWSKYDNDLFQTGRLVTCGLYINITLYDYLRTIVNLNRTNSTWTLDPRMDTPKTHATNGTPKGVGNQVSAEFAMCYRWHAAVGETDEAWTEQIYEELFGKSPEEVDLRELMIGLSKYDRDLSEDPMKRPFAHLERGSDGKYDDGDLAQIMTTGIEQVAGAFGALNHPKALRAITVLGIKQARSWNLCTLNEFRKYFGLKQFDTFEEINPDPKVAEQLKNLYEHPDYVELYPGIMVEEAKTPMVPGVGICPNHTLARAVLSDAVALVRGDRFYTVDYNPKNLTAWGYNEVQYDLSINHGCVFYKLMLRALPNHFKSDSIYCHHPMTIPEENAVIMKDLGRFYDYNWEKPKFERAPVVLKSYSSVKHVLHEERDFKVIWNANLGDVVGDDGAVVFQENKPNIMNPSTQHHEWRQTVKQFYEDITMHLIQENTVKVAGINQIDITRDVGNLAYVQFAANVFDLPLKTKTNPQGLFDGHEFWTVLSVLSTAVLDSEPTKAFPLKMAARKLVNMLGQLIEQNTKLVTATGFAARLFGTHYESHNALADYGAHLVHEMSDTGMSTHDMAFSHILPTIVAMVPSQSELFTQMLDFYLGEGNKHLPDIKRWAEINSPESDEKLLHYVQEGIRLNCTHGSYRRARFDSTFDDAGREVHARRGDRIFCDFIEAARDSSVFPHPDQVDLNRPLDSYLHYGLGTYICMSKDVSHIALTAMLRSVAKLPGLRRAPGPQGELKRVTGLGGVHIYMREGHESTSPFPCTMKIHYDYGPAAKAPKSNINSIKQDWLAHQEDISYVSQTFVAPITSVKEDWLAHQQDVITEADSQYSQATKQGDRPILAEANFIHSQSLEIDTAAATQTPLVPTVASIKNDWLAHQQNVSASTSDTDDSVIVENEDDVLSDQSSMTSQASEHTDSVHEKTAAQAMQENGAVRDIKVVVNPATSMIQQDWLAHS